MAPVCELDPECPFEGVVVEVANGPLVDSGAAASE